jgi:hypothetical protein
MTQDGAWFMYRIYIACKNSIVRREQNGHMELQRNGLSSGACGTKNNPHGGGSSSSIQSTTDSFWFRLP